MSTDNNGDTVLAYEIEISGSFTSGNNGATLEGATGRSDIDYDGVDILRARDLATITSDFTLDVRFPPSISVSPRWNPIVRRCDGSTTLTRRPKNDTISPCETATNGGWNLKQKQL